jgi:chromosomal replication initiation ATPase DnaA
LLMTARSWPASWRVELPDLASRIKAATIVEIGEPDELLLTQVMFKLFADRQVDIDAKIVNYLVMRMERSLAVAQQIVERMDHLALSRKVAINRAIALEVLTELETAQAAL